MWQQWFGKKNKTDAAGSSETVIPEKMPRHIAIIMDGNGRWAKGRGLPRAFGHRAGVESLREVVTLGVNINLQALTVYAFSTENWKRPSDEVGLLMSLFSEYLDSEIAELHEKKVQIRFIGDTSALNIQLQEKIKHAVAKTSQNTGMVFNLAVNYGGRAEILRSVQQLAEEVAAGRLNPQDITEESISQRLYTSDLPDPDLLIRPSGDYRISNFLLWQLAYTEFWFVDVFWPDFTQQHLLEAIYAFQRRERRFGGLKK